MSVDLFAVGQAIIIGVAVVGIGLVLVDLLAIGQPVVV
ncbi:MAG: hypothetical protein ACI8S6_002402 [Myxococcota bacterium]